ncbi:glycoside hydrolase family 47 protein [Pluteus cervinus]|uniref:Glycoside hydrolase family 47 protein n=1 Tax=Pluteus cervinus TaxID=181527 RepID=A0ACD3B2G6_9AGAR|nr:glycoside hydrolase family 47 protein [Pluteus cervinus]
MPEPGLRKRKKGQDPKTSAKAEHRKPVAPSDDQEDFDSVAIQKVLKYVSLFLVCGFGLYASQNPSVVTDLLGSWIGFSEHWDGGVPRTPVETVVELDTDTWKRGAIVTAFKHAWSAYERDAMGDDEYHPISQQGSNLSMAGGIGYTVIDAMDTMQIMGLHQEYERARHWVATKLSFDRDDTFSTFETTIRVLGGLLSSYHLSGGDSLFLEKAVDIADRLLPAFDTVSGLPRASVNLARGQGIQNSDFPGLVSVAEVATLQLEMRYLSYLTENTVYWEKAERVMHLIKRSRLAHGLASVFMSEEEGVYITSAISLGSRGDSYYEYLLKQYLQTNRKEDVYKDMYDDAMESIHNFLIQKSKTGRMIYTSELIPERLPSEEIQWRQTPKQDHLVCFLGGSLMLGATRTGALVDPVSIPPRPEELSEKGHRDWKTGGELIKTCMNTHDTATGLSPETVHFRIASDGMDSIPGAPEDWYIKGAQPGAFPPYDARYMLRPETIESLFIAYRLTGDPIYREYGWKIFRSIETHNRIETGGYATVVNVDEVPVRHEDKMETFMLSETLKYLYLLFSNGDVLPLDKYVFNTEAHPLPIFDSVIKTGFS